MRQLRIVLASVLLVPLTFVSASAWNEPDGFRGVPWGTNRETVKEQMGLTNPNCFMASESTTAYVCSGTITVGGVEATVGAGFSDADALISVVLFFESKDFDQMKAAFLERYGKPTSRETPTIQNRMGAKFEQERLLWTGTKVVISLSRYADSIDKGRAVITTAENLRAGGERSREKAKSGGKDL